MSAKLVARPAIDVLSRRSPRLPSLNTTTRRHESSYRRSKNRLNIKPEASFLLSNSSPMQDHIIFNAPSSAPSVLHTPLKFLPKDDKRRQILAATAARTNAAFTRLPPAVNAPPDYQRHHLREADVAEIQRLRTSDPDKWSTLKLARKFNCSKFFIGMVCEAPKEKLEREKARLDARKAKWGPTRTRAREDRVKRRELSYRGD